MMSRCYSVFFFFFFSSRRRHTRCSRDWSSDVCSSDLWRRRKVFSRHPRLSVVVRSTDKLCSPVCRSALLAPVRECSLIPVSRKEPGHEVHCGDGHADAKEHTGKDSFRAAFAKGEGQP